MKWEFPKAANKLYKALRDLYKLIIVKRKALEAIIAEKPEPVPLVLYNLISNKKKSTDEIFKKNSKPSLH
jgi:hypothetical protein